MNATGAEILTATLARDAMRAPVVAVDPSATLREIASIMGRSRIHSVVVDGLVRSANGDRLIWAVVGDHDVVRALADGRTDATAGDIAGTEALTVDAGDDLATVCAMLSRHGCAHAIVVRDERPVGIVSTLDIASAFGD